MKKITKNFWVRLILILTLGYFLFFPISGTILFNIYNYFAQGVIVGLKVKELTPDEYNKFNVPLWQREYASKFNAPPVVISLDYIYIPQNIVLFGQKFCITEVIMQSDYIFEEIDSQLLGIKKPICVGKELNYGINYFINTESESSSFIYKSYNQFWYPFDTRTIQYFNLTVNGSFIGTTNKENNTLDSHIQVTTTPPLWRTKISDTPEGNKLTLSRLYIYQILYILLPISVLLIIFFLPSIVSDRGSFWEVTVALVFGLSGLSELFVPSYVDYPTLASSTLLSLYIAIAIFIIITIIKIKFDDEKKNKSREKSVMDLALLIPIRKSMDNLARWGADQIDKGLVSNEEIAESFLKRADLVNSTSTKNKLKSMAEIFRPRPDTE